MALGMTLILVALRQGDVGMVAILSSTTPVTTAAPAVVALGGCGLPLPAWAGALLATLGTAMVLGAG